MRAVMCVDLEPDERTPSLSRAASWSGADDLLADAAWLRGALATPVLNWFVRIDSQIEVLHGRDSWAVEQYAARLVQLMDDGDEVGVHPHNWRYSGGRWTTDGDEAWSLENAERALAGYAGVFGSLPPSFRYGDRFVSDAVVRMLLRHPEVRVDLTAEPGAQACLALVEEDHGRGIVRNIDQALSRRYRPSIESVEIPAGSGTLTAVPLTTAVVPESGSIDTLMLWRDPGEFRTMLDNRRLDSELDHMAFAIRADLVLVPWARDNVERNLRSLHDRFDDLEWVRASELALGAGEQAPKPCGVVGALATDVGVLRELVATFERQSAEALSELDATRAYVARVVGRISDEAARAELAHDSATAFSERLGAIEATVLWRIRQRLLPLLRPLARCRRTVAARVTNSMA